MMVATKNKNTIKRSRLAKKIKKGLLPSHIVTILGVALVGISLFEINSAQPNLVAARPGTLSVIKVNDKVVPHKSAPAPAAITTTPPAQTHPVVATTTAAVTKAPVTTASAKPEPVVTPSPSSNVSSLTPVAPTTTTAPTGTTTPSTPQSSTPTTTAYTSTNWSGYMSTVGSFNQISAAWTATNPTGVSNTTSADSSWIGIGGVSSSDLIQVGTQNTISPSGQISTSAFYELLPAVSQPVPGVTVRPGDSISASLTEISSNEWSISITDLTDNQTYTSSVAYTSTNSSAEWIEEDPSYSARHQIPFDNFQTSIFSSGATTLNGTNDSMAASNAQPITMEGSRSAQTLATPSAITSDGGGFNVTRDNTSNYD
jgi:hypothetical protein